MQMSLAKGLRIEKDQITSHFIHRSDVDDVILVERVTSGALSCKSAVKLRVGCTSRTQAEQSNE
jgi:hypothetical protein